MADLPAKQQDSDLLAAAPGLVRLAVAASLRTATWSLQQGINLGNGALKLMLTGEGAERLTNTVTTTARDQAKRLLGVTDLEQRVGRMPEPHRNGEPYANHAAELKELGAELLARSNDIDEYEPTHPAYERILTSLAPDEARILRLMCIEGPRAAVDVRTWRPLDVGSELVEPGLTLIGQESGLRYTDRVPAYLNNLYRLGLIWFSREAIDDLSAYQVLEAQPDVQKAMDRAGRGKTVRRSIRLTPFGRDFCEVCLPLDTAGFLAVKNKVSNGSESRK